MPESTVCRRPTPPAVHRATPAWERRDAARLAIEQEDFLAVASVGAQARFARRSSAAGAALHPFGLPGMLRDSRRDLKTERACKAYLTTLPSALQGAVCGLMDELGTWQRVLRHLPRSTFCHLQGARSERPGIFEVFIDPYGRLMGVDRHARQRLQRLLPAPPTEPWEAEFPRAAEAA